MSRTGERSTAYGTLRRTVVRVLRRLLRAVGVARALVADELAELEGRRNGSRLDIRAGRYVDDRARRDLPIVVIVATGSESVDCDGLAAAVEQAQVLTGSFRPLFVVDHGAFAPFRARGFAVEHVMSESSFTAVRPHDTYADYLYRRVASITRSYGAQSVVPLNAGDQLDPRSLCLIGAVPPSRPRD